MKTSSAKAKGRRCCQEVKGLIHDNFPELSDADVGIASSGQNGEDILLSPQARGYLPISIECKNTERLNIWKAIEQAEANAEHFSPIVFFRRNRSKLYAVVDAEDLMWMLRLLSEYERENTDQNALQKRSKQ